MSEKTPFDFEKDEGLLYQIKVQRTLLEKQRKKSVEDSKKLIIAIGIALVLLMISSGLISKLSDVAVAVGIGTLLFIEILVVQFRSLRREIENIVPEVGDLHNTFNPSSRSGPITELDVKMLGKVYDINKNTIDKLFDKLKTFSNTWLAVSGGIASAAIVEIFKSGVLNPYSVLILITCSAFLWSITQDLYGILNYELAKKTKDLAYWWIATVRPRRF